MGIFHKQKSQQTSSTDDATLAEQHFFDENFREELRNHGRLYFEKVINENGSLFKQDLDATIAQINIDIKDHVIKQLDETISQVNAELKDHVTKQLDGQFEEYSKALKDAQTLALDSLNRSATAMETQHQEFSATLQKSIANQGLMLTTVFQDNMTQMNAMKDAQAKALEILNNSASTMQEQYEQLAATLQKNVLKQEATLINAFEGNMAKIIERYLLGALGDQFDLKAQLPSIIKQLEANKQAIVDDMNT
jgi:hypothetical protein